MSVLEVAAPMIPQLSLGVPACALGVGGPCKAPSDRLQHGSILGSVLGLLD